MSLTGDTNSAIFGETATTSVDHTKTSPYECLTWAAIVFSTPVKDDDHDGLPDKLEDSTTALRDPDGLGPTGQAVQHPLPNLHAMGASSSHKDIFVEVNAMKTTANTVYGSASAPFDSSTSEAPPWALASQTDASRVLSVTAGPHNHLPTPEVIRR